MQHRLLRLLLHLRSRADVFIPAGYNASKADAINNKVTWSRCMQSSNQGGALWRPQHAGHNRVGVFTDMYPLLLPLLPGYGLLRMLYLCKSGTCSYHAVYSGGQGDLRAVLHLLTS
jgi:hypothetical protein